LAWIESHQSLPGHPKTRRCARKLGVSIPTMVGLLHMLWYWAMDYAQDGDLTKFEHDDIADAMQWDGDADQLVSVLIDARFLDQDDNGLVIHDWFDYAGRLIEKREQNNERKRRSREKRKKPDDGHGDVTRDGNVTSKRVTGLPNQTEPNQPNQPNQKEFTPESLPPSGDDSPQDSSQEKGKGTKGKGSTKPHYSEDSPYYMMAVYFKDKVEDMAKGEGLTHLTANTNLQTWANDFRLLVEKDKHGDKTLIREVMDWVVTDSFWKSNIMSASSFRDKFPKLVIEMRNKTRGQRGRSQGASGKAKIEVVPSVTDGLVVSDAEMEEYMKLARQMSEAQDA